MGKKEIREKNITITELCKIIIDSVGVEFGENEDELNVSTWDIINQYGELYVFLYRIDEQGRYLEYVISRKNKITECDGIIKIEKVPYSGFSSVIMKYIMSGYVAINRLEEVANKSDIVITSLLSRKKIIIPVKTDSTKEKEK